MKEIIGHIPSPRRKDKILRLCTFREFSYSPLRVSNLKIRLRYKGLFQVPFVDTSFNRNRSRCCDRFDACVNLM